jgi:hypothetical protein
VKDISGQKEHTMKNILAITILMFGLAGGALAQDYSSSTQAPKPADTQSTDNKKPQTEATQKADCKADKQSSSNQQPSSTQQDPDQAPQNVVEYGG